MKNNSSRFFFQLKAICLLLALVPLVLSKSIDTENIEKTESEPKSLDTSRVKRAGFSFLTGAIQVCLNAQQKSSCV